MRYKTYHLNHIKIYNSALCDIGSTSQALKAFHPVKLKLGTH